MDLNQFGLGGIMQQAQKMKEDLRRANETLATVTVEAVSRGNLVRVSVSGKQQILSIKIAPEAVVSGENGKLEELIQTTVNDALRSAQEMVATEMAKVTGGLGPLASLLKS